jgi:hypothetical protein
VAEGDARRLTAMLSTNTNLQVFLYASPTSNRVLHQRAHATAIKDLKWIVFENLCV